MNDRRNPSAFTDLERKTSELAEGYKAMKEQVKAVREEQTASKERLGVLADAVGQLGDDLQKNTEATSAVREATGRIEQATTGVVDAFNDMRVAIKVLDWVYGFGVKVIKWTLPIAIIWGAIKAYTLGVFTSGGKP